jgi:2-polyprenyl-3-methyl-5-hydroxy-6-metoxy-1,4-benzoquinol methylase
MEQNEILEFYNNGAEIGRLERGIGKIELERTKEIISRYLPDKKLVIYDVGGGIGVYSKWLAELGNNVHLIELSSNAVEYAQKENIHSSLPIKSIEVGDARSINKPDASADVVLLMGPLYHLTSIDERKAALNEAHRVLKKDGLLICAGISRYGSMLWAFSVYKERNSLLDETEFMNMVRNEINEGQHIRPDKYPYLIARAYFHLTNELESETANCGFKIDKTLAVEGPSWLVPDFESTWESKDSRKTILDTVRLVEEDKNIIAMSPHFLTISRKVE